MAIAPVTLVESLRPWSAAGLAFVLADGPVRLTPDTAIIAAEKPVFSTPGTPAPEPRTQRATPPSSRSAAPFTPVSPAARPQNTAKTANSTVSFASCDSVSADPQNWPEPWRGQMLKTKAAPVIWTYHELGLDLAGFGDPAARSSLFRKIIAALNLPKGSSAFWPCAMPAPVAPEQNGPESAPALFAAGVLRLAPKILIFSGKQALADAGLASIKLAPFTQSVVEGKLLVAVPDTADLLRDATQVATTVTFLQIVLQSLGLQQRES